MLSKHNLTETFGIGFQLRFEQGVISNIHFKNSPQKIEVIFSLFFLLLLFCLLHTFVLFCRKFDGPKAKIWAIDRRLVLSPARHYSYQIIFVLSFFPLLNPSLFCLLLVFGLLLNSSIAQLQSDSTTTA
jgi:hypothetical protein